MNPRRLIMGKTLIDKHGAIICDIPDGPELEEQLGQSMLIVWTMIDKSLV